MSGLDDLVALANAGFSKEEIVSLVKELKAAPVEEAKVEVPKEPEHKVEAPKEEPKVNTSDEKLDELNATMNNLIESMRLNAINNTQQPTVPSAEDVLASIINP